MKITVVGSINKDIIMRVARRPEPGETVTALDTAAAFGGKGANQAVAAARLGAEVTMIGALGHDAAAQEQLAHLEEEGVRTDTIMRCDTPSGVAYITVDEAGENSIILYPGANYAVTAAWIEQNRRSIEEADVLMLQLEIPAGVSLAAAEIAAASSTRIIFNPAPVQNVPPQLYPLVDVMTPNESELALLAGFREFEKAADELLRRGAGSVLATLGKEGSRYHTADARQCFRTPTYLSVPVVDTTAAGDSFNAALAVSLATGKTMQEAAAYASAVASIAVSRLGAQPSLPFAAEVEEFITLHSGELEAQAAARN
jgi:ribokinase